MMMMMRRRKSQTQSKSIVQSCVIVALVAWACAGGLAMPNGSPEEQSKASLRSSVRGDESMWLKRGQDRMDRFLKEPHPHKFSVSDSVRAKSKELYQQALRTLEEARGELVATPQLVKSRYVGGGGDTCSRCLSDALTVGEIAFALCTEDGGSECDFSYFYAVCQYMTSHCSPCSSGNDVCSLLDQ